jgi:hypothetical protein
MFTTRVDVQLVLMNLLTSAQQLQDRRITGSRASLPLLQHFTLLIDLRLPNIIFHLRNQLSGSVASHFPHSSMHCTRRAPKGAIHLGNIEDMMIKITDAY